MADTIPVVPQSDTQYFFEVKLDWLVKNRGILHVPGISEVLHVAAPPEFGGDGKNWSPEHLFLSAVSSCYMSTFLVFAGKMGFGITHLACNAIGQVEIEEGKYKFTHINLYPSVFIADESLRNKATRAMEKTQAYCLVGNSVNATLIYHNELLVGTNHIDPINQYGADMLTNKPAPQQDVNKI